MANPKDEPGLKWNSQSKVWIATCHDSEFLGPSRKEQNRFPLKEEAKSWKGQLKGDCRVLRKNPNYSKHIRRDKRKHLWVAETPAAKFANRTYSSTSNSFATSEAAINWLIQQETLRGVGFSSSEEAKRTLRQLVDSWLPKHKTKVRHTTYLRDELILRRHVLPYLASEPLVALDVSTLEDWKLRMESDGFSSDKVDKAIKKLRQVLDWGIPRGWVSLNAAQGLSTPLVSRAKWSPLKPSEIERLGELTGEPELIATFIHTALREGELFCLQVKHVLDIEKNDSARLSIEQHFAPSEDDWRAVVSSTKTHLNREVPVNQTLRPILASLIKGKRPEDFIFNRLQPMSEKRARRPIDPREAMSSSSFRRHRLRPAFRQMGIEYGGYHLLRKTSASLMLEAHGTTDKAMLEISRSLGHKDVQTTYRFYVEIYKESSRDAINSLHKLFEENKVAKDELQRYETLSNEEDE
jgi:integrase